MYYINKRSDGSFEVKKQDAKRASKIFDNKLDAIKYCETNNYEYKINTDDAVSKTVNSIKKHGIRNTILLVLVVVVIGGLFWFLVNQGIINFNKPNVDPDSNVFPNTIEGENFSIHFLELGNEFTGDSTYIKAGENDILIDAGSRKNSAPIIKNYLDKFVTDGKLEYVIATHAHQDHIAGFIGSLANNSRDGIFYQYKIDTLIDFNYVFKSTKLYEDYLIAREMLVKNGTKHYTAAECFNNENGASRRFNLGENLSLDIIYNKYYFEPAKDENEHSVCTMFNSGDTHFFLTGDLEKHGEASIVEYYDGSTPEKTLPQVDVFKAGHHGSPTSSGADLLSIIKPKICTVCCCAGGTEYTIRNDNIFPSQAFIDRIAKYTDSVYVTSRFNEVKDDFESLNGDIVILSNGKDLAINCSKNNTKLKDSTWFNEKIYVKIDNENYNIVCDSKTREFFTKETPGAIEIIRRVWPKL